MNDQSNDQANDQANEVWDDVLANIGANTKMHPKHSSTKTAQHIAVLGCLSIFTFACSNDHEMQSSEVYPAKASQLSSISIPVPSQLQAFLGEDKINGLQLKIMPKQCDEGVTGTNIERFVPSFGSNSASLANERLQKGCTYALAISLGKANSQRADFERIYLTNDTKNLWTIIQVPKTGPDKIQTLVRVFPTNDGKSFLGLAGEPIDIQGLNPPPSSDNQESLEMLVPGIPGNQQQQPSALNWKVVLMASDQANQSAWISAFDNARNRLLGFFRSRGVDGSNIRQLSIKPQHQTQSVQAATVQNFTSTVATLNASGPQDACLIHMTSHGSRDGFNIGSSRLKPSALGAALDAGCGNRPTVLLVSACYSGLYTLDSSGLKKPNRVILTAARSDRTSFGCSAENEFTFWDGCLLETLPTSPTFKILASNIQSCIARKEAGMPTPSLPQAFIGSEVENLKIPGAV